MVRNQNDGTYDVVFDAEKDSKTVREKVPRTNLMTVTEKALASQSGKPGEALAPPFWAPLFDQAKKEVQREMEEKREQREAQEKKETA